MYFFQFRIQIFYRNNKLNIILNAFFRLLTIQHNITNFIVDNLNINKFNFDIVNNFNEILIQITNNSRNKLIIDYTKNFI